MSVQGDLFGFRAPLDVAAVELLGRSLWASIRGHRSASHFAELANLAAAGVFVQAQQGVVLRGR